jgi:hypothetical protein
MIFDNDEIVVGDAVFDCVWGAGIVIHIQEAQDRITVNFGTREVAFSSNGVGHFPNKTLYWKDPVGGFIPMKNDDTWAKFVQLRDAIATTLARP